MSHYKEGPVAVVGLDAGQDVLFVHVVCRLDVDRSIFIQECDQEDIM